MKRVFPHITIILALMTLVFFVIEQLNAMMAFMTSKLSQYVFAVLAVSAIVTAILLIKSNFDADRRARERRARQARRNEQRRRAELAEQAELAAQAECEPPAERVDPTVPANRTEPTKRAEEASTEE